ncbi:hypothetical protein CAEBREN_14238 [Caenorhabditis brenneri]|uniref:Uncharacterized protein n=1 Tax=Caenorhabditis brenneri TaxID=135651 RepID=G0NGD9_CAEBE|nr:hypothetical protein CAEBREN_14238 [Caenorhabditis brenneri]
MALGLLESCVVFSDKDYQRWYTMDRIGYLHSEGDIIKKKNTDDEYYLSSSACLFFHRDFLIIVISVFRSGSVKQMTSRLICYSRKRETNTIRKGDESQKHKMGLAASMCNVKLSQVKNIRIIKSKFPDESGFWWKTKKNEYNFEFSLSRGIKDFQSRVQIWEVL